MRLPIIAVLLTGCTLVDQNTFNPHAGDVPVVPPAPVVAVPRPPDPSALLTFRARDADPSGLDPATRADLHRAVAAARARKPNVEFDVTAIVSPAATTAGSDAADIARAIVAEGVTPAHVRLSARPDPEAVGREVRVYVR